MAAPRPYDEGGREAAAASFGDREERERGRRGKQRWPHSVLAMEEDVGPLPLCSATGGRGIAVRQGKQQWSRSVLAMKERVGCGGDLAPRGGPGVARCGRRGRGRDGAGFWLSRGWRAGAGEDKAGQALHFCRGRAASPFPRSDWRTRLALLSGFWIGWRPTSLLAFAAIVLPVPLAPSRICPGCSVEGARVGGPLWPACWSELQCH